MIFGHNIDSMPGVIPGNPAALGSIDLLRRGTLWHRYIASLGSRHSQPGWSALDQAMKSGTLSSAISQATYIATAIHLLKRDGAWTESGESWSQRKATLEERWPGHETKCPWIDTTSTSN
jgi:hypothetical protein